MGFKRKTSKRSIPVIVVAVVIVAACTTTFLAFAILLKLVLANMESPSETKAPAVQKFSFALLTVKHGARLTVRLLAITVQLAMLSQKTGRQILGGISLTVMMVGIITNMFLIQSRR